jgi:hypothetical protein
MKVSLRWPAVLPVLLLASLLYPCLPARAWAPQTRVRMTDEAVRFMPATLRLALETHRESLLRGMLGPQTREDNPEHKPSWSGGTLESRIDEEARGLLETLGQPRPFEEIAEQFGILAHYVMDAGFPPGVSDGDGDARYAHFAAFCEERRSRFPLVFYGHDDPALERHDYLAFARGLTRRSRDEDRVLARAYAAAGDPPNPAAFDDRSVPFAVGSLCYSRTINDVVRVWLAVWNRAGGDTGRTPYAKPGDNKKND